LDLSGLRITAAVFDGVESLKLRILSMQRIPPDLEVAGKLTAYSIKELSLNESTINDDFVAQLALEGRNRRNELVRSLEKIDLSDTLITEASLKSLASFAQLRIIRLKSTKIKDARQVHELITRLPLLRELDLSSTLLTSEEIEKLQKACPKK